MRIVHVVLSLDVGGQERLILNLSRALAARGHDVHVVSLTPGGTLRPQFGPVPTHDVPKRDGLDPLLVPKLARALSDLAPDVVHTHNLAPLVYGAPAARLARVPRIVHTKHGNNAFSRGSLALARFGTRCVSAFVPVSEETAVVARKNERPAERILRVIPNGIPLDDFARNPESGGTIRDELGIPRDAVVVGTVGRLVSEKDYPFLVRAMTPLLGEKTRLVLVGEGNARADIEAAIPANLARFVTLTGIRSDVPRLLASFDVFALSSRTEGLPLVVPEAMACGLPVVATSVGGLPGIVPPHVGTLVAHGDTGALSDALGRYVNDATLRAKTGSAAQTYAHDRFSLDRMTRDYEALYARGP